MAMPASSDFTWWRKRVCAASQSAPRNKTYQPTPLHSRRATPRRNNWTRTAVEEKRILPRNGARRNSREPAIAIQDRYSVASSTNARVGLHLTRIGLHLAAKKGGRLQCISLPVGLGLVYKPTSTRRYPPRPERRQRQNSSTASARSRASSIIRCARNKATPIGSDNSSDFTLPPRGARTTDGTAAGRVGRRPLLRWRHPRGDGGR